MTHPPQAGGDPELLQQEEHSVPNGSTEIGCSSEYATSKQFESSLGVPNASLLKASLATETATFTAPDIGGPKEIGAELIASHNWPQTTKYFPVSILLKSFLVRTCVTTVSSCVTSFPDLTCPKCLHLFLALVFMANARTLGGTMHTTLHSFFVANGFFRTKVLLTATLLTSKDHAAVPPVQGNSQSRKSEICLHSSQRSHRASPNSTVMFRRAPKLWTVFQPELHVLSSMSAASLPVCSQSRQEPPLPRASLDPLQDLGLYLDKLVVPQLGGVPATQVPWLKTDVCGVNSKQAWMMKTCLAPFSYGLLGAQCRARCFRLARHRKFRISKTKNGPLKEWQQVGPTCLCHENPVPALRGTIHRRWPPIFSRQCLLYRYSHNPCPPVQIGGSPRYQGMFFASLQCPQRPITRGVH